MKLFACTSPANSQRNLHDFYETEEGDENVFLQQCIALHNSRSIDLVGLPRQAAFAELNGHAFFVAQHLYCDAIPKLESDVSALMECCRILIEKGGSDLAANQPNGAFRTWCKNNPSQAATIIRDAQAGDVLAKQFVTFALQAANDIDGAIDLIQSYADDRRLSGMAALAGMSFADSASAPRVVSVLEPYVADGSDDHSRINALVAAFEVLKQHNDASAVQRLIEAISKNPGPQSLYGLARIVWLHHAMLDSNSLRVALEALQAFNPEHQGTLREIDMGLRHVLDTKDELLALDFLTVTLKDTTLKIGAFESVAHKLASGNEQRLYELVVRWLLSGSLELCDNVNDLVGHDKERAFDTTVQTLGLTSLQQIFLCRKAIGFLFVKSVICCSIIVSILRAGHQDVEDAAADLLFDPILLKEPLINALMRELRFRESRSL